MQRVQVYDVGGNALPAELTARGVAMTTGDKDVGIYRNANSSLPARSRCLSTSQPYRAPLLPSQELETPCNKVRPPRQKLSRRTRSRRRRHRVDLNQSST